MTEDGILSAFNDRHSPKSRMPVTLLAARWRYRHPIENLTAHYNSQSIFFLSSLVLNICILRESVFVSPPLLSNIVMHFEFYLRFSNGKQISWTYSNFHTASLPVLNPVIQVIQKSDCTPSSEYSVQKEANFCPKPTLPAGSSYTTHFTPSPTPASHCLSPKPSSTKPSQAPFSFSTCN